MHKNVLIISLFLIFCCANIFAQPLEISGMDKSNLSSVSVDFNNKLSFKNLSFKNDTLVLPSYKSKNKEYFYFSILDRNLKNKIIAEIKNDNTKYNTDKNEIEYKINKFYIPQNTKKVKAFISVIFNDKIEVNASILDGKYGLWVAWPSKKEDNKWVKIFSINNKALKDTIEKEILEKYNERIKNDKSEKQ